MKEISLNQRLSIPDSVVSRNLGDECIILDLNTGTYFGLDPVGRRVWQLLTEPKSLADLLPVILTEYDVAQTRLEHDLRALASELFEQGLLQVEESET